MKDHGHMGMELHMAEDFGQNMFFNRRTGKDLGIPPSAWTALRNPLRQLLVQNISRNIHVQLLEDYHDASGWRSVRCRGLRPGHVDVLWGSAGHW